MILTTPLSGMTILLAGWDCIAVLSLQTKFEVSKCTRCEAMNGGTKCRKWVVRGHSRSSAMSQFDRAHTTSYSTLIETMRVP